MNKCCIKWKDEQEERVIVEKQSRLIGRDVTDEMSEMRQLITKAVIGQ